MPTHYHLLLRSVRENLSAAVKDLGGRFAQEVNRIQCWDGPLFRGRFRSELIEADDYLLTVAAYIHLNPVRASLTRRLDQHCWASHRAYLGIPNEWLSWELVTELAGGQGAFAALVADLRTGGNQWPEGFDLDTGMRKDLGASDRRIRARPQLRDRRGRRVRPCEELIAAILEITGVRCAALMQSIRGRVGNSARRFTVWASSRDSDPSQAQIGDVVEMAVPQISHTLRRVGSNPSEPLASWMEAWELRWR